MLCCAEKHSLYFQAHEYLEIANHYFNWSVTALGERDYRQCLTLLKDCHFPLKEAQRFGKDDGHQREYALLEEDIYTQQCVAESVQERIKGNTDFLAGCLFLLHGSFDFCQTNS